MPRTNAAKCNFLCEKVWLSSLIRRTSNRSEYSGKNLKRKIKCLCSKYEIKTNLYSFIYKESTTPPVWYLQALTNLREEDDVTDTETEAWWTWDPGFPGLPCTRQIYSPESSGEADRIRSWLPRTCRQQTGSHFHPSVISICDTSDSSSSGLFFVPLLDRTKGKGEERGDFMQD